MTVSDKIAQRKRQRLVKTLLRSLVGVVAAALLAGAVWAVFFSDLLTVEKVQVVGIKILKADEVQTIASVPMGEPMARVLIDPIAQRVSTLAAAESVTVRREWPHTIVIDVTERVGVISVRSAEGAYVIDKAGVKFQLLPDPPAGLVVANVAATNEPMVKAVAEVVDSLPKKVRDRVATVSATGPDSIILILKGGAGKVIWGNAQESELKGKVLNALLKTKASVYDVSSPTHPSTKD